MEGERGRNGFRNNRKRENRREEEGKKTNHVKINLFLYTTLKK